LAAPVHQDGVGPELEFRAFITQVASQPSGINEAGDLDNTPYRACQTYIKGSIRLDRPLLQLCPRDVRAPLSPAGETYVPPPPPKPPPPTVNEELEKEASRVIGLLAFEFASMCHEYGLEDPQIVGPKGEIGKHAALGNKGVKRRMFVDWLEQQMDGTAMKEIGTEIRPAIVRLVRAENKDGPSCGLGGNEHDARYSYLRDYILKHLFRALNQDVETHRRKRDERLWRSPSLSTAANAQDADALETDESNKEQDESLSRLAFEYELQGDFGRARELHEERLALEKNVESAEAWYGFARFLMRYDQNQLDAEQALRYCLSLTWDAGSSFKQVAFLACLLQNRALPCSLDAEGHRSARFEAALALLEVYADRHATDRLPLYFLFLIYSLEAYGVQAELAAASEAGEAQAEDLEEMAAQVAKLQAEAAKYLEMARAPAELFTGTLNPAGSLGRPSFDKLETLVHKEQINRNEATEVPSSTPEVPAGWKPPEQPVFPDPKSMHRTPDPDDAMALDCIDLLLHFGFPGLVRFLFTEATETYGFLSPISASSDRCTIQMIKASMSAKDWTAAEQLVSELFEARGADRNPEAHALLGEIHFQAARAAKANSAGYHLSLASFERALSFLPGPEGGLEPLATRPSPKEDPVLHLRVAYILHLRAEEGGFEDAASAERAVYHYKRSLLASPTAEAWKSVGACAYRSVRNETDPKKKIRLLKDASRYLTEANVLDRERPQITAWLAICAVELGKKQIAKQSIRQVLQFEDRLDTPTALELASLLLRFSDERRAHEWNGERGTLVQDGCYAQEAAAVARIILSRGESGQARHILARALALSGEFGAAAAEFCAALPLLVAEDQEALDLAADMARKCAGMMPGEPQLAALVEEAIEVALQQSAEIAAPPEDAVDTVDQTNLAPLAGAVPDEPES